MSVQNADLLLRPSGNPLLNQSPVPGVRLQSASSHIQEACAAGEEQPSLSASLATKCTSHRGTSAPCDVGLRWRSEGPF